MRAGGAWFALAAGLGCAAFDPFFTPERVSVRILSQSPFSASRKAFSRLRAGGVWVALAAGLRCAFGPAINFRKGDVDNKDFVKVTFFIIAESKFLFERWRRIVRTCGSSPASSWRL